MTHGSMSLRFYQPRKLDTHTPLDQDAMYIVASGRGTFATGPSETALQPAQFGPGDAIFVPAGHVMRFIAFSSDFGTWIVLWGRRGGES
jgi:mannose-6-phosphate isomerase-like protein (cupin superfamily)